MKVAFIYGPFENHGIECLSAVLKQSGHQTKLFIDNELTLPFFLNSKFLNRAISNRKRIIHDIKEGNFSLVAFSVLTNYYHPILEFAKEIKESCRVKICFGGIHPSSSPEECLENDFIDYVIIGEGEFALLELINNLEQGEKITDIQNLWFKDNGSLIKNNVRDLIQNLNALPFPDKEIYYNELPYFSEDYVTIISRGCNYNCAFCWHSFFRKLYVNKGKYLRWRSPDNVIEELLLAKEKYNYKMVQFDDDNLLFDLKWLNDFSEKYRKHIKAPFKAIITPYIASEEMIKLLAKANCKLVEIGVQTVNEYSRKRLDIPGSLEKVKQAVDWCKEYKIKVWCDHILGLPFENNLDQDKAVLFYNELKPNYICTPYIQYYPKTRISEEYKQAHYSFQDIQINNITLSNNKFLSKYQLIMTTIGLLPHFLTSFLIRSKIYKILPTKFILPYMLYMSRIFGSTGKYQVRTKCLLKTFFKIIFSSFLKYNQ